MNNVRHFFKIIIFYAIAQQTQKKTFINETNLKLANCFFHIREQTAIKKLQIFVKITSTLCKYKI